jgi:hypothetical protein
MSTQQENSRVLRILIPLYPFKDKMPNAKLEIESRHINTMDNTIIVPPSVRVLIKMGTKSKKGKVETLVGMLKEYKDEYTSVELQKETTNWREST